MGWAQQYGHLARHSADIQTYPDGNSWNSMLYNYGQHVRLARYQKPGFFNDPDFLNVDHPSYTLEEKKSHFALWCVFSAPLLLSADLTAIKDEEVKYLTNRDLLAINQDRLVQQATLVSRDSTWDVLTKSVQNGDRILAILNRGNVPADHTVTWEKLGFPASTRQSVGEIVVKNLWTGDSLRIPANRGGVTAKAIPAHGTAVFRITKPAGPVTPTGLIFKSDNLKCLSDIRPGTMRWVTCNGLDSQTWQVRQDGRISSLLRPEKCAVNVQGKIRAHDCGSEADAWNYHVTGNLVSAKTNLCLTEATNGDAIATACGYLRNEQVLSLPVGVAVLGQ
ncbi:hypothetical protein CDD83_5074 [Cordyceps sp. RAO-2017]|nr:hypothetical protein CDD83_5074 [Cordyceps sp. RAO-2017]